MAYKHLPGTLKEMEFTEISERFREHWHRLTVGRVQEMVYQSVEGGFPTFYSSLQNHYGMMEYRYVRVLMQRPIGLYCAITNKTL